MSLVKRGTKVSLFRSPSLDFTSEQADMVRESEKEKGRSYLLVFYVYYIHIDKTACAILSFLEFFFFFLIAFHMLTIRGRL